MLDLSQASAASYWWRATVDAGDSEPNESVRGGRCYCAQQHVVRMTASVSSL